MKILTKAEVQLQFEELANKIKTGQVFIHPTDTIYGISCNATNETSVKKVRDLKERQENPFSIWAPSIKWIEKNCVIDQEAKKWLKELPGPYTLILKLKNKKAISKNVNPGPDTIGVRIPNHWFSRVVEALGFPIITTSANKAVKPFMTNLEDLDSEMKMKVDFIIYEGEKKVRPSKIINLVKGNIKER